MDQIERRKLAIKLFGGITLSWIILCYLAWILSGCKAYMPFISDFDLYQPGDTIFSIGTALSATTVIWVMFELQLFNRMKLTEQNQHLGWHLLNHAALVPGIIAAYSCYMVGQTPWDEDGYMHGNYAFEIFFKGVYWCLMMTLLSVRMHWGTSRFQTIMKWRTGGAVAAAVGLWQMIANQATVWTDDFDWDVWNAAPANKMEFCTSKTYPALHVAAVWEYVLVIGIVVTVCSFLIDLTASSNQDDEE